MRATAERHDPPYPGVLTALDGRAAVVAVEAAASPGAATSGSPSAEWRDAWAAAVTAGLSLTGMRASAFSGGQGVASMHESLFASAGKRLTFVLNVASRAMTKQAVSAHAGHDDYHAVDDTGLFQLFARDVQAAADLTLIAHRIAELALTPGLVAQDAFLTSHVIASARLPERELVAAYLGDPADRIESPTPSQRLVYGKDRRRIPELFDVDYPAMLGAVQTPDSYAQGVAAQRPFYFDHVAELTDRAMAEYATLTGRAYARARGYRLDDAEYVLVGQGSIVSMCEAVCDHLRGQHRLRVGVLDLTMFRPFPADLISHLLAGKKAVTVLERVDQPLAVDPPLVREIRATMSKAIENGRVKSDAPHAGIASCRPRDVPDVFAACFGLGSRDVQPADLIAAVGNMIDGAGARRQFYLGIDFVRPGTRFPKVQVWQEQLADCYPRLAELALAPGVPVDLLPPESVVLRVHAVDGPNASALTRRLALIATQVLDHRVLAHPAPGSGLSGRSLVTDITFSAEPIRVNAAVKRATMLLASDPNVFAAVDQTVQAASPLDGLADDGAVLLDGAGSPEETWQRLPATVRRAAARKRLRVYLVDASGIASDEASGRDGVDGLRDAAFLGAVLKATPLATRTGLTEAALFHEIYERLVAELGQSGSEALLRAMRRGFAELTTLDPASQDVSSEEPAVRLPVVPPVLGRTNVQSGIGHGGRFWEQVGVLRELGQDGLADPFAATGAIPAATSAIRDMTASRLEVPAFVADRCTGCGECWVQCPDAAIPGVVSDVGEVLTAAIDRAESDRPCDRLRQVVKPLAGETRRLLKSVPFTSFGDILTTAYATVAEKLDLDPDRRQTLDAEFGAVHAAVADFPLARTEAFFDVPERQAKGSGGLLSITINPEACKGCGTCVSVCPEGALEAVSQTDAVVDTLRRNWSLWQHLPETHDRYVEASGDEASATPLSSLLLKQSIYQSTIGGDGASPGSPEKRAMHLVLSAVNALVLPRVKQHVARLTALVDALDARARELLASDAKIDDVETLATTTDGRLTIPLESAKHDQVEWLATLMRQLKDLRWRYTEGPSGKGRATCGMTRATDRASAWSSTYPYNPYPFPWVSHLLHDAPSVALGVFEGQMRKMADGFAWVRRGDLTLAGEYDAAEHEPALARLGWQDFSDEEFALCPPVLAVGSDGAMVDAGFQHLSHLLVSGKPIRVVVLDTVDSGEPGESRKDLALLAMAHRHAFVLQSSPAASSHLLAGVLRGLESRAPAVFALHCPRVADNGVGLAASNRAAKLALESRAFPALIHDPDAGPSLAERLSLDGNPSPDALWPSYELAYVDEAGVDQTMTLPVTVADWAATETEFSHHFTRQGDDTSAEAPSVMRFDEYLAARPEDREGVTPFIYALDEDRRLGRLVVGDAIVALAQERLDGWRHLRQMAGLELSDASRDRVAATLEADFQRRLRELESTHQTKMADIQSSYPTLIARRLVAGLIRAAGDGSETIGDLLRRAAAAPGVVPLPMVGEGNGSAVAIPQGPTDQAAATVGVEPPAAEEVPDEDDESLTMDPYIQSVLCTTCDECININKRMFAYNKQKQAYIKDAKAGTYRELVLAAEKCPVAIIHPGTPLNPDEKDLEKWVQQAARFR